MCGFCGFSDKTKKNEKKKIIKDMADRIIHRGPDSDGYYIDDNIALGFRRLSIIDLKGGNQPLYNEDNEIIGNIVRQEPALPKLRDDLNINDIFLRIQASAFKNNVIFPLDKQICCFWNYVGIKNINNSISYSCTFSHITKTKNEFDNRCQKTLDK